MAQLILVRHAPVASNYSGHFSGNLDVPWDSQSLISIEAARPRFQSLHPDVVFSSPLSRALMTAQFLFPSHSIEVTSDLAERDLGNWNGGVKDVIRQNCPQAFLSSGKMSPLFCPPSGEDWKTFEERGCQFVRVVKQYPASSSIVAVTHNGVIRLLRHLILRLPINDIFASDEQFLEPVILDFK